MNSLTSTRYGSRVRRHGRSRPCRANQRSRRRRNRETAWAGGTAGVGVDGRGIGPQDTPTMRAPITAPLVAAVLAVLPPAAFAQTPLPPDSAVRAILADRLPGQHGGGFVVGLLDADGTRRVVNVGAL